MTEKVPKDCTLTCQTVQLAMPRGLFSETREIIYKSESDIEILSCLNACNTNYKTREMANHLKNEVVGARRIEIPRTQGRGINGILKVGTHTGYAETVHQAR